MRRELAPSPKTSEANVKYVFHAGSLQAQKDITGDVLVKSFLSDEHIAGRSLSKS